MIVGTARVFGVLFQALHINDLLAASSDLNRGRSQVAKHIEVALEDRVDAFLNRTVLLKRLSRASLYDKLDELFNVCLLHFLFSATLAKFDLITIG